jgi:plastocyanin
VTATPSTSGDDTVSTQEPGLTAEEAIANSVFVGRFDATLSVVSTTTSETVFELVNVGAAADDYSFGVEGPSANTAAFEPQSVSLEPGESVTFMVTGAAEGDRVNVQSAGLGGRIAAYDL